MFVAALINTFHGRCDLFGMFKSHEEAYSWIETQEPDAAGASYSIIEVQLVHRPL